MQVQYRNDDGSDRDDEEEYDGDDDKENASTDRVSTNTHLAAVLTPNL